MFNFTKNSIYQSEIAKSPAHFIVDDINESAAPEYKWQYWNTSRGIKVCGTEKFKPAKIKVWTKETALCPEFFFNKKLASQEATYWKRILMFKREKGK